MAAESVAVPMQVAKTTEAARDVVALALRKAAVLGAGTMGVLIQAKSLLEIPPGDHATQQESSGQLEKKKRNLELAEVADFLVWRSILF